MCRKSMSFRSTVFHNHRLVNSEKIPEVVLPGSALNKLSSYSRRDAKWVTAVRGDGMHAIRHKLNFQVLRMLYFAFVHPHLLCGIEIYGNTYQKHLHKLIILNNKILRVLPNVPYDTPVVKLYADFFHNAICLICTVFKFYSLFINLFIIHINYLLFSQPISPKIICFIFTVLGHKTVFIPNIFEAH